MALLAELGFLPLNTRDDFNILSKFFSRGEFTDDYLQEEMDLTEVYLKPPDAELDCHVDEGSGVITVCETFYDHDLSDIPAELLEALRKSGCCLSVLEDMLMDDDVIYDK